MAKNVTPNYFSIGSFCQPSELIEIITYRREKFSHAAWKLIIPLMSSICVALVEGGDGVWGWELNNNLLSIDSTSEK